jgi:hypothetical protein
MQPGKKNLFPSADGQADALRKQFDMKVVDNFLVLVDAIYVISEKNLVCSNVIIIIEYFEPETVWIQSLLIERNFLFVSKKGNHSI